MSMKNIGSDKSTSSLTGIVEGDVQPNAVDLRLGKVFRINADNVFVIDESQKVHRGAAEITPDPEGYYFLEPGSYEVQMQNIITVGPDEAGWVITRSTLNRNGVFLTSGLYDSEYNGQMAAVMHVGVGAMKIQVGTRIGQYLNFDAEALHGYDGDYGLNKDGSLKEMEKAYRS